MAIYLNQAEIVHVDCFDNKIMYVDSHLQYVTAEWKPAFLSQAREFLFFPLPPREASKRVPIFDRGTGSKPERLRSCSLQADLSLIV